jgi:Sulfotransferase family
LTANGAGDSLVTVSQLEFAELDPDELLDFQLYQPAAGSSSATHSLTLEGHVVTRTQGARQLELFGRDVQGLRLPIGVHRPDLAQAYPDMPWVAAHSGFRASLSVLGLPDEFSLGINVVLEDNHRRPVATLRGRRRVGALAEPGGMQPLLITTIGRTGSQMLLSMLDSHPEIANYPPWTTETRVASYWADVFYALASPRSYVQAITSEIRGSNWWLGEWQPFEEPFEDRALLDWLGNAQVEQTARFCRDRIDAFYDRLAKGDAQAKRYFVEKCVPAQPAYVGILRELYANPKEVILVRDFRDVLCSMLAWNERFGLGSFGRDTVHGEEEFVRGFMARQVRTLMRSWKSRAGSAALLRYEDLVLEPREAVRGLLEYLDLDIEGVDTLLGAVTPRTSKQRDHGTSASALDSIGRWRKDLDASVLPLCEEVFGPALETFGYSR